jgi:RNA polymerase sigma-70 factor (ECF subfamily)
MTLDPNTRLSLIANLVDLENEEAWTEFVLIYQPVIQRFLLKYGMQFADAAEVTQEVLAGVVSSIGTWEKSNQAGTFRGWLFRITRNKAVDLIRKKSRQAEVNSNSEWVIGQMVQTDVESADSDFMVSSNDRCSCGRPKRSGRR